jgi:hypothetical protein
MPALYLGIASTLCLTVFILADFAGTLVRANYFKYSSLKSPISTYISKELLYKYRSKLV